jgi:hypothetical protein
LGNEFNQVHGFGKVAEFAPARRDFARRR